MLTSLFNRLGNTLYIQIWSDRIKVTEPESGQVFEDKALVAYKEERKGQRNAVRFGFDAEGVPGADLVEPFAHPRALLNDFFAAQKLLQHIFANFHQGKPLKGAPLVVIQPMEKLDGGLTMIEERAFQELALGAGAREAIVYAGDELDLHSFDYQALKQEQAEKLKEQAQQMAGNSRRRRRPSMIVFAVYILIILLVLWFGGEPKQP